MMAHKSQIVCPLLMSSGVAGNGIMGSDLLILMYGLKLCFLAPNDFPTNHSRIEVLIK